ncbi:prolipoprotein diacylglyceryl transferase [Candidatus Dependentiae bacterium]|nr:prolipoprotein diacylglyceryl transferase [Candidatus Dependentiae bacterium]
MNPIILHIWGPFAIHAYGFLIVLGICLGIFIAKHDAKLQKIISFHDFLTVIQIMVLSGYLGGRILCIVSESWEAENIWLIFKFWKSGLSIQGGIISIAISLYFYAKFKKIPLFQFLDRIALYSPLVHGFGRLGCFFAGCCYGKETTLPWSVIYNHPDHMAPLHTHIHPTQLYSSALSFLTFAFLYFYLDKKQIKPGTILFSYLILISSERFIVDFFRADQTWFESTNFLQYLSINQWISLAIIFFGVSGVVFLYRDFLYPKE